LGSRTIDLKVATNYPISAGGRGGETVDGEAGTLAIIGIITQGSQYPVPTNLCTTTIKVIPFYPNS
jgi:hypothetical protein